MSLIHTLALVAVLATSTLAAADAPRPPAEKKADKPPEKSTDKPADKPADDTVSEEDARRFLAFFEQLVAIVVANKDDCAKMAAGMNAHIDANQPLIKLVAEARNHNKHLPQVIKDKIAKKSAEELTPAMVAKCNKDRGVKNALLRLLPPPPGTPVPPEEHEREHDKDRDRK